MATHHPPFPIPANIRNGAHYIWAERRTLPISDGDPTKWPTASGYRTSAQEFYLCHLGQKWAEQDGLNEDGVHYYIDRLPTGYGMFEINQPGGPQIYKRLFGHPSGRFYDSTKQFEPHFLWLMSGMEGDCTCRICFKKPLLHQPQSRKDRESSKGQSRDRPKPSFKDDDGSNSERSSAKESGLAQGRAQRRLRQSGASYAKDEEGNEDVYKDCVKKLELAHESKNGIEIDLTEENSIDWKADRECLPQYLTQVEQQHVFVPRIGELVLWCSNWPDEHYLFLDPVTLRYGFYSFKDKKFLHYPRWRGGIIAAVPTDIAKNGSIDFPDILDVPKKSTALTTSGFRVETMPDPNDDVDKSLSKQYKHVPLRNIRPLSHWHQLLRGTLRDKLHPSILNAISCMTSISLLEKWRFQGTWPHGSILCKGIYLGSELIIVGDTIRLSAADNSNEGGTDICADVLVVTSIRYNIMGMKPEHAQSLIPSLSTSSYISFVGTAFTTDALRAHGSPFDGSERQNNQSLPVPVSSDEIKVLFNSVGANEYGPWYPLHGMNQRFEISHEQVLGKLYEADAVRLWTGQRQSTTPNVTLKPAIDFDVNGIVSGRRYAAETDERLPEPEKPREINWYLADTRAQALSISSLNGLDVGQYCTNRDAVTLQRWRHQVKIADGREVGPEIVKDTSMVSWAALGNSRRGRPAGSKVIDGRLVLPDQMPVHDSLSFENREEIKSTSQMAEAALASDDEEAELYQSSSSMSGTDDPEEELKLFTTKVLTTNNHLSGAIRMPTKLEIVASMEKHDDLRPAYSTEESSEEEDWLSYPTIVRGGTEESSGGDYEEG